VVVSYPFALPARYRGSQSGMIPSPPTTLPAGKLRKIIGDPVTFAQKVFGHSIWGLQAQILQSVATNRQTAVKSCHSSGKTFLSAAAVLWWITNYPDGIAVTTAPTWSHVKTVLWGEIRNNVDMARERARNGRFSIVFPNPNTTELRLGEKNYAVGLSTNKSARMSGFHSGRVLIILDEAPGVHNEIWDAIQGLRASGEVSLLAIGNPTIRGGPFHDAFTLNRERWNTFTISAFDTPNLQHSSLMFPDDKGCNVIAGFGKDLTEMEDWELDRATRPYLCRRRWVREMYEELGASNPLFQAKVLGEFPTEADDSLIPLSWLERAQVREEDDKDDGERPKAGLDVAGPGEAETVLVVRVGSRVVLARGWADKDARGQVVAALAPYKVDLERLNVDSVGMGWYMFEHLRDVFGADKVHAVNVGTEPRNKEKFVNAKAEFYWALRQRVQSGDMRGLTAENVGRATADKLIGQLSAIRYKHDSRGRIMIESKDEMQKRGMKSPDYAEALMLAYVDKVRGEVPEMFPIISLTRSSPWRMGGNANAEY
jgi:phage terminase large subunit